MRKFVCIALFISLLICCFCVNGYAFENNTYDFVPLIQSETSFVSPKISNTNFTVLTKFASGEFTIETKSYQKNNYTMFTEEECLNISPYSPELSPSQQLITTANTTTDSNGRYQVSDARVGLVNASYDTDGDGIIDETVSSSGSLQHYDIVVSCAHVLWSPRYADLPCEGWAIEVEFYAGVNGGDLLPTASSSYSSISISQALINEASYSINSNGTYNVYWPLDHDWSIIQLNDNIGSICGWYGLHGCGTPETGVSVYTIGYPDNRNFTQWRSDGIISSFSNNKMYSTIYISSGYSGAPILNSEMLYGIATGISSGQSVGVRMFDKLFGMIVDSRNESEARWG